MLSTVTRLNADVLRIWLAGMEEPIELTGLHRLYSEDRQDWVPAGELVVGEKLRTVSGPLEIQQIGSRPGVHRVYNLEVETEHCYYVSTAGVLSHNTGTDSCGLPSEPVGSLKRQSDEWLKKNGIDAHELKEGTVPRVISHFDIYKDTDDVLWALHKNGTGEPNFLGFGDDFAAN